jgi:apolipoprotein N-acyltransferase
VGYVTRLGLFFLLIYLSLYWLVFGYLAKILIAHRFYFLTIPSAWVILEFLRENIWAGFGWAILGYSQYSHTLLIQSADILGAKFISWLIVIGNITIFEIFRRRKVFIREFFVFSILIVLTMLYGHYRLSTLEEEDYVKLALAQTNIAQSIKWDPGTSEFILKELESLSGTADANSLLIYPEASYPFCLREDRIAEFRDFFKKLGRDVLIGVVTRENAKFYNEAIYLNQEGKIIRRYRKLKLVPFGEYVPLRRFFKFIKVISSLGDISPGEKSEKFSYKGKNFSVLICFEDLFPFLVSRNSCGSDFLVNITNDAWFYGEPQASQHLGIMILRAVENRISIARVANTGITGFVTFRGEASKFVKRGHLTFVKGVFDITLPLNKQRSFYTRFPDAIVLLAAINMLSSLKKR